MNVSHYGAFLYSSSFSYFVKKLQGIVLVASQLPSQLPNQLPSQLPNQLPPQLPSQLPNQLRLHRQLIRRHMILDHLQLHRQLLYRGMILNRLQLHRQLIRRHMILDHLQLHRHYKVSDGRTHSYFFLNLLAIFCKLTRLGSSTSSTSSGSIW